MNDVLFTPWRYAYITADKAPGGCFLCSAAREPDDPQSLVVHRAEHHLVILNRHPYATGHLMVAPHLHCASPAQQAPEAQQELWPLVLRAARVLTVAYSPEGMNMGLNLGQAAGAGTVDHFHFHLVPRWLGDCNFMGVIGGTRLVPEELSSSWAKLRELFPTVGGTTGRASEGEG